MNCYFEANGILYSPSVITKIDCTEIENLRVKLHLLAGDIVTVEGLDAIEIVMKAKASLIEGKRFKFHKGMWIIHNMVAHPLMQILALMRLFKLAIWIHEITVPKPREKYVKN